VTASWPIVASPSVIASRAVGRRSIHFIRPAARGCRRRPDQNQPLYLLTNDSERPTSGIARLYKERWDIELLFK
jgi:IS4 transposase